MIKISDGKIGTREFTALILHMIAIKFTDTTPALLISLGKNAAWMIPIFSSLIIGVPFLVLLSLLKKHNQGLMELVFGLAGKKIGSIIGLVLFLVMFGGTVINTRIYVGIVNTMFYQKTPVPYLLLMLLAFSYFLANRGMETIGRTAWIVTPYVFPISLLLIILVRDEMDWVHIFPIAGPGITELVKNSFTHSSIFGEIIILAAFLPFVRSYKDFRLSSFIGFGIASLQIAVFTALYVMVFDYPAAQHLAYPFQDLTRAASIGEIITHAEAIFLGFWVISSVIHFAIYLYIAAFLFGRALRLNEFEPLLLPLAGLVVLLGLIPDNTILVNQYRQLFLQASSGIVFLLPFLLWMLDRWKGRVNIERP